MSTGDPSSTNFVISLKKSKLFIKHDLALRNPCCDVFINLFFSRNPTMWSLINVSTDLHTTDAKFTGV